MRGSSHVLNTNGGKGGSDARGLEARGGPLLKALFEAEGLKASSVSMTAVFGAGRIKFTIASSPTARFYQIRKLISRPCKDLYQTIISVQRMDESNRKGVGIFLQRRS